MERAAARARGTHARSIRPVGRRGSLGLSQVPHRGRWMQKRGETRQRDHQRSQRHKKALLHLRTTRRYQEHVRNEAGIAGMCLSKFFIALGYQKERSVDLGTIRLSDILQTPEGALNHALMSFQKPSPLTLVNDFRKHVLPRLRRDPVPSRR